ncbi:hypothetical protein Moror_1345 [Moniliophthora roreri MCA 2997]|uniref:Uncharacterized protein n=2 Tax=Moniliophthora roreri TaxID=221103 RepID=V2XU27_MONRO|nr:hypothetical protein Moror_1345 [Moniliophthora roreri MCA 2997]
MARLGYTSCHIYGLYREVLYVVSQFVVCLLLTLRIYALYCADRRILWLFGISALVAGGISGYILAGQDSMQYSVQIGCNIGRPRQIALCLAGLWLAVFVYDTIIFGLTALRTYQCWREARDNPLSLALNLFSLFFRDGAMYFAMMTLANLANILTFCVFILLFSSRLRLLNTRARSCAVLLCVEVYAHSPIASTVMLCRLMLNLHATANTGLYIRPNTLAWSIATIVDEDSE